jgi:hypothetical protein
VLSTPVRFCLYSTIRFFSFGKGKRRKDYFKDLALAIVPARTGVNGAYIARTELAWVALSPQKVVQNLGDGTFRKLDLVAYSARSDQSRIGKPHIRISRSVKVVMPRPGDLMYRENILARKQGAGYLLTDGDAIHGASGGVLVATHADGRKLAVGVFKGFVVDGANFKGLDHVGLFDPKKHGGSNIGAHRQIYEPICETSGFQKTWEMTERRVVRRADLPAPPPML